MWHDDEQRCGSRLYLSVQQIKDTQLVWSVALSGRNSWYYIGLAQAPIITPILNKKKSSKQIYSSPEAVISRTVNLFAG
jgi:hypothetical protein